jgi:hypothetical protein
MNLDDVANAISEKHRFSVTHLSRSSQIVSAASYLFSTRSHQPQGDIDRQEKL